MKNKVGVEVVALGVTELFRIVAHENGRQREYTVHYETGPDGNRELLCILGGEVCFGEGSCTAPIADLKRIKEALAEHLQIPVAELLKPAQEEGERKEMKPEELILALAESNIDRKASDEIIERIEHHKHPKKGPAKQIVERATAYDNGYQNGLRDGRAQESESFTILEACKGNMKEEFEASPKMLLEIDQFTDDQMERIAEDVGSRLEEHFWNALRLAVEAELEGRRMKKKLIFWKHAKTGTIGHGKPLEAYLAAAWVKRENEAYPDTIHMAVDADITKMQGCLEEVSE